VVVWQQVLRRIFGPKWDEVTGEWSKLHSEERHNMYSSPNIIKWIMSWQMRRAGHVPHMWDERKAYRVLMGKPTPCPSHHVWFDHPNNIWWRVQIMELLTVQFLQAPAISSLLSPNDIPSYPFSDILNLCSFLYVTKQVSHPY
jgi:hypothetical protein